jgi:hypothetical protein
MKIDINKEFVFFTISYAIIISLLIYSPYQLHILGIKILELAEYNNELAEQNSKELAVFINSSIANLTDIELNQTHIIKDGVVYNLTAIA